MAKVLKNYSLCSHYVCSAYFCVECLIRSSLLFVHGVQGSDHARDVRRLDSGKVVYTSSNSSKSKLSPRLLSSPLLPPSHPSPLTPRSVLDPTSPLYHPISPQHKTSTSSTGNGAIQLPHPNQSAIHQESFRGFPKQSPNSNSPSYWDSNILRGMLRFS